MKRLVFLILLISSPVWGASYYVDYQNGSDSNNGTETSPVQHCPGDSRYSGSITLVSGDIVYFKSGTVYTGTGSGTLVSTTIEGVRYDGSWDGDRAVIDLANIYDHAFSVSNTNITIQNFDVLHKNNCLDSTSGQGAIDVLSSGCILKNISFKEGENWDTYCSSGSGGGVYATGIDVKLDTCSDAVLDNVEFYRSGRTALFIFRASNVIIKNCDFHDHISVAIRLTSYSNNITIQNNLFHDMWQYEGDTGSAADCHAGDWLHIYGNNDGVVNPADDPYNITIEKNFFYNDRAFQYANGTANSFIEDDVGNITWRNNLIINPHQYGLKFEKVDNARIENNTFVIYDAANEDGVWPLYFRDMYSNGATVKNNVIISYQNLNTIGLIDFNDAQAASLTASDHNVFYAPNLSFIIRVESTDYTLSEWQAAASKDINSNTNDPQLLAIPSDGSTSGNGDYHLSSNSTAAIDQGEELTGFNDDYDGHNRIVPWDIGAYEYGGQAPPPDQGLQHPWEEVDQMTTDVKDRTPIDTTRFAPPGGTTGQVLMKMSDADYDVEWQDYPSGSRAIKKQVADRKPRVVEPKQLYTYDGSLVKYNNTLIGEPR